MWLATTLKAVLRLRNLFSCLGFSGSSTAGSMGSILGRKLRSHMPHGLAKRKTKMEPPCCRQGGWGSPSRSVETRIGAGPSAPPVSGGFGLLVRSSCCYSNQPQVLSTHFMWVQPNSALVMPCVTCPHSYPGAPLLRLKHEAAPGPSEHQGLYNL